MEWPLTFTGYASLVTGQASLPFDLLHNLVTNSSP
jgi:hypothetical protein